MNELIWVGNTLLPRWLVFSTMAIVFMSPWIVAGTVKLVGRRR